MANILSMYPQPGDSTSYLECRNQLDAALRLHDAALMEFWRNCDHSTPPDPGSLNHDLWMLKKAIRSGGSVPPREFILERSANLSEALSEMEIEVALSQGFEHSEAKIIALRWTPKGYLVVHSFSHGKRLYGVDEDRLPSIDGDFWNIEHLIYSHDDPELQDYCSAHLTVMGLADFNLQGWKPAPTDQTYLRSWDVDAMSDLVRHGDLQRTPGWGHERFDHPAAERARLLQNALADLAKRGQPSEDEVCELREIREQGQAERTALIEQLHRLQTDIANHDQSVSTAIAECIAKRAGLTVGQRVKHKAADIFGTLAAGNNGVILIDTNHPGFRKYVPLDITEEVRRGEWIGFPSDMRTEAE